MHHFPPVAEDSTKYSRVDEVRGWFANELLMWGKACMWRNKLNSGRACQDSDLQTSPPMQASEALALWSVPTALRQHLPRFFLLMFAVVLDHHMRMLVSACDQQTKRVRAIFTSYDLTHKTEASYFPCVGNICSTIRAFGDLLCFSCESMETSHPV